MNDNEMDLLDLELGAWPCADGDWCAMVISGECPGAIFAGETREEAIEEVGAGVQKWRQRGEKVMITQQEYKQVDRECQRYRNLHPGLVVSFSNTFIKVDDAFRKVFWVDIGEEPWPFKMLVTRKETQSFAPQEAFDKAMAICGI